MTVISRLVRGRPALVAPQVVNLVPDPGFRAPGDLYVHVHSTCDLAEVPGRPGVTGARVAGRNDNDDTHIAPGGRNAPGVFRLGMRPGGTYTAAVSVYLPEPLTGGLNSGALRILPGYAAGDTVRWTLARSTAARNEHGHHRISVTFTVPEDATAAWIRLHSGMTAGHGTVYWYAYSLVEGDRVAEHFDGDTPDDDLFAYAWTGVPNASPSVRTLRVGAATPEAAVRWAGTPEGEALLAALDGDPLTVARAAAARGDTVAARAGLRRLVKTGDPDGSAAYALGLLDLGEQNWPAAVRRLRTAVEKAPGEPERAYRLAYAYDKLKKRADSRSASAAGLRHDTALPFDGPALLDADVKCFGARREVGLFLAANLDQIRVQAEQRLARPALTALRRPVFLYWGQGFDQAPPLVRACADALAAVEPDLHLLTDANIGHYVDVPGDLVVALDGNRTHFSDLLRLLLLEKFGGVWVDATCWVSEPLGPHIDRALEKGSVFAFHYHGPYISSWLLAARRGSYPVHLWRAALLLWWEQRGELIDYFLLHHFYEMLHHLEERFRAEWEDGLRLSSGPPHALQETMLRPYDPARFREITAGSFVHKLRYKYQPHEVTSGSYLSHLIRRDLP